MRSTGQERKKDKNCRCGIIPVTAILLFIEEEMVENRWNV